MNALSTRAIALLPTPAAALARSVLPLAIGVALSYALHTWLAPSLKPFHVKMMMDIGINIILAVSLNLVNGMTGQFSVGHAGFMAIGGYVAGAVTYYGSFKLWGSAAVHGGAFGAGEWLFVGGCLAGGAVAALAGYVVGLPSLRLRGDYLAIVTLGFGEIIRVMLQRTDDVLFSAAEIEGTSFPRLMTHLGGALGFTGIAFYSNLFWIYCFVVIVLIVAFRLKMSTHGRAYMSVREDEIAAEAMGVPTTSIKVQAFVLAALFAGIAGGLFAHEVGVTLNPRELAFQKSFDILIMVVLGGLGSISGAALAAIVLTILPEALRGVDEYRMIIYALALIIMMIVRPQGLFGLREIWDFLPRRAARSASA